MLLNLDSRLGTSQIPPATNAAKTEGTSCFNPIQGSVLVYANMPDRISKYAVVAILTVFLFNCRSMVIVIYQCFRKSVLYAFLFQDLRKQS